MADNPSPVGRQPPPLFACSAVPTSGATRSPSGAASGSDPRLGPMDEMLGASRVWRWKTPGGVGVKMDMERPI